MTDEELIARLRAYAQIEHAAAPWGFAGEGEVLSIAADRIEALKAALRGRIHWIDGEGNCDCGECEALFAALKGDADDL